MSETQVVQAIAALNRNQRDAYDEPGNTILLAGPGSGKTATLVLRVARLLDETPAPRGVACLTYSTEAAREFERRLRDLGIRSSGRLFTGTVHAFCLSQILRPFSYLLAPDEVFLAQSEIAAEAELATARKKGLEAAGINDDQNWWRSTLEVYRRLALIDRSLAAQLDARLPEVCTGYEAELRRIGKIDFDDIILGALSLVSKSKHVGRSLVAKYPWLVIDEYQDLGLALHRIVTTLVDTHGAQIFAVGDPDQSIYAFSGARPEFLDELANRKDVRVERLELNYRCRQEIIDASLLVLQPETDRNFHAVQTDSRGELIFRPCPAGLEEQANYVVATVQAAIGAGVSPADIAVLGSRWEDLYAFEQPLTDAGVPYRLVRGRNYRATPLTMWIEDLAAWCAGGWKKSRPRMVELMTGWQRALNACYGVQPHAERLTRDVHLYGLASTVRKPDMQVGEWISVVSEGLKLESLIGRRDVVPVRQRHDLDQLAAMIATLRANPHSLQTLAEFSGTDRNKIILQSLHGSKGLEYSVVFMIGLESGVIPRYRENPVEARRLFYVGMTRARREVHLLWSGFYVTSRRKTLVYGPSPFLLELQQRLKRS